MKQVTTILLLVMLASSALAADNWVEVSAKGQGSTRDKAIQNGLYLAVCQVQGVAVRSDIARVDVSVGSLDVTRDEAKGTKRVEVEGVRADMAGNVTLTEAKGLVRSFDVVSERQISPELYEVDLKVRVYDYQSPEDTKKLRVAIFPFESLAEVHRFGSAIVPGKRLGEQFSQYLGAMLSRNEKFTVLDRQTQQAILKEKRLLSSDDAPLEEKVRLGEALGADYMLVGDIPQAEILVMETSNPAIGGITREFEAYMDVEYKLLVGPTRQIALADQMRIRLENDQVKALVEDWKSDDIDYNELEQKLVQMAASRIADSIMEYLYPVRIAALREGGMLILNRGGQGFADGDVFEVYRVGGDIIDPETGKSLGKDETKCGIIMLTKVLPRISYAKLLEGAIGEDVVGSVCRRVRMDIAPEMSEARPSSVRQSESGGVRMPFDDRGPSVRTRDR